VPRLFLTRGFNTLTRTCITEPLTVLQTSPAVNQPASAIQVVHGLIGARVPPLEDAAGFMAPGPDQKRGGRFPMSRTMSWGDRSLPAGSSIQTRMHIYDGAASSAVDLSACQQACLRNASCTRFDWSAAASVGERCWIHGPWSSSQSRRISQGVEHYELIRGSDRLCGKYTTYMSRYQSLV